MDVQPRHRLLVAVGASALVVLAVLALVLLTGGGGPTATPTAPPPATATPSADPGATPEAAVRGFVAAYAKARESDDPAGLVPYVTSTGSSAYLSAAGFLQGQKESGKASVTTVLRLENMTSTTSGDTATVTFDYTEGGYDISAANGSPLESPVVLATRQVTVTLKRLVGRWLVDEYQSR